MWRPWDLAVLGGTVTWWNHPRKQDGSSSRNCRLNFPISSKHTSEHKPKELKVESQGSIHPPVFTEALFIISARWQQPVPPWTDEVVNNNVAYAISLGKEGHLATCYTIDKTWRCCANWHKPATKTDTTWVHSHEVWSSQIYRNRRSRDDYQWLGGRD